MQITQSERLLAEARVADSVGKWQQAAEICAKIIQTDPRNSQANLLFGVVEAKQGRLVSAIDLLKKVEKLDPGSALAPLWLSMCFRRQGDLQEALFAAERSLSNNPNGGQEHAQIGACLVDLRQLPQAEASLRAALQRNPEAIPILCTLSKCLLLQGLRAASLQVINDVLQNMSVDYNSILGLARHLLSENHPLGAVEAARLAVKGLPKSASAHLVLGRALVLENAPYEAEVQLRKAVNLDPDNAELLTNLGNVLQAEGELERANHQFLQAIAKQPTYGFAHYSLAQNRRSTEADRPHVDAMSRLLIRSDLPLQQASYLHYGLGRSYEDLGQFAESMANYDAANRIEHDLKHSNRQFDRSAYTSKTNRILEQFDKGLMERSSGFGSTEAIPIFVVGMMRSGTTLVEQILSSHPFVGGAGEQWFWPDNWRAALDKSGQGINADSVKILADRYCRLLKDLSPGNDRIIDKLPANHRGLGMLYIAFPRAKILHIRRHPVDTCLSIYATPNRAFNEYAYNRDNIVVAYREYQRLMAHWRSIIPAATMLEVDYEDLVRNDEFAIRRILEFCELPWNDLCLHPEKNRKAVVTPSVWQVRQPIYKSAINRWKKFEPWLGSFGDLL